MAQGKYGLSLSAIAILAFILSFFGFIEVLVLVVAYALLIEKNPWLTRQTLQALYLSLAYKVSLIVVGWIFGGISTFFGWVKAFGAVSAFSGIQGFISFLIHIAMFVLVLLAILKLAKDQDAGIPIVGTWADKTMGMIHKATTPTAPVAPASPVAPAAPTAQSVPAAPVAPAYQSVPAMPVAPTTPVYQPAPAAPVIPAAPAAPVTPVALAAPVTPVALAAPAAPVKTSAELVAEEGHVELFQSDDYEPVVVEENIEEIEETAAQSFQESVPGKPDGNGSLPILPLPEFEPTGASSDAPETVVMSDEQMKAEGHVELFESNHYEPVVVDEAIEETEETAAQHFQEATPKAPEIEPVQAEPVTGTYTMPAAPVSYTIPAAPAAPAAPPAVPQAPAAPSTATSELKPWFCTSCGQKNHGNFCMSCGKRRM